MRVSIFALFRHALLALVVMGSAPSAAQQQVTTTYGPFVVTSTGGTQLSNVVYTINVVPTGALLVEYTAAGTHCSDVRMHFLVDGVERALSGFLSPGLGALGFGPWRRPR